MSKTVYNVVPLAIFFLFSCFIMQPVFAEENETIILDFYYSSNCGECDIKLELIQTYFVNNESYKDFLTVNIKDVVTNETAYDEWKNMYGFYPYPFVIIKNSTTTTEPIGEFDITVSNIKKTITLFLMGNQSNHSKNNGNIIQTPWGEINISEWSLPILTIILGGLDSFNPCAFFILIFLLNLLIYARSRRRMLLIGGIFIFFSGLLYMLFMFLMYETFTLLQTTENMMIITILVGLIVLPMGLLNIKDFFFFKKGATLSIPDDKKPKIYKQMRRLVKNPELGATILGTIALAATVNFYELLCTLGLPFAFTRALSQHSISTTSTTYYIYILLYNFVYVIPLIIIVLIFVFTLGKRKLTEWHGRIMKLISGIMLSSFGIIFLYDYKLLENPVTPILLLLFSLLTTALLAVLWKKKNIKREEN